MKYHAAGEHAELGMGGGGRIEGGEPAGFGRGVVVEQGDERGAGGGEDVVVGRREAEIAFERQDADGREVGFKQLEAAVAGAAVGQDDVELDAALGHQGRQVALQQVAAVEVDDGDGDAAQVGRLRNRGVVDGARILNGVAEVGLREKREPEPEVTPGDCSNECAG